MPASTRTVPKASKDGRVAAEPPILQMPDRDQTKDADSLCWVEDGT